MKLILSGGYLIFEPLRYGIKVVLRISYGVGLATCLREASLGAGGALLLDPGVGFITHRSHGAGIYGNMDPINIPPMLAYIAYMDPMGYDSFGFLCFAMFILLLYVVVPSNSAQRRDVQTCSDQQTTIYSEC